MTGEFFIELVSGSYSVRIDGFRCGDLVASGQSALAGWWGTPEAKVPMTERQTGDGAHSVPEDAVLYSARTVTIDLNAMGLSRDGVVRAMESVNRLSHQTVRIRVVDGASDTFATGYIQTDFDGARFERYGTGVVTVVCADPRRYSTQVHRFQLLPTASSPGGLSYGEGDGLAYDLTYGADPTVLQNYGTVVNAGNSPCYPTVTVTGPMDPGVRFDWEGGSVGYGEYVGYVPLVLDSLTRTASVDSLDVSRNLTDRSFPSVPAGGSISMTMQATGTGWATVEWRDTYI